MLKLSTKSRYGLRAMIELAVAYGNGPVEMSTIAKKQDLSRKYLHALLSSLKDAGLTESIRGARGGYQLSRPPEEILVSDIFEALEGRLSVVSCVTDPTYCDRLDTCLTAGLWKKLNSALLDILQGTTLAQLSKPDTALSEKACLEKEQ